MSGEKPLFPFVIVDVALFTIDEQRVKVLLVKREVEPFAGSVTVWRLATSGAGEAFGPGRR